MDINHLERFKNVIGSGKTAIGAVITLSDLAVCECASASHLRRHHLS